MGIHVYHYKGGSSDKIWAIESEQAAPGIYIVWYGRRGGRLTQDTKSVTGSKNWFDLAAEKKRKGYEHRPNLTISDRKVVPATELDQSALQDISAEVDVACFYWSMIGVRKGQTFNGKVDTAYSVLAEVTASYEAAIQNSGCNALREVYKTPLFKDLCSRELQGEVAYSEGPLSYLLLYALRKTAVEHGLKLDVVFDDGNQLPEHPLKPIANLALLEEARVHWLDKVAQSGSSHDVETLNDAIAHLFDGDNLAEFAQAMNAITIPLNIKALDTKIASSFF